MVLEENASSIHHNGTGNPNHIKSNGNVIYHHHSATTFTSRSFASDEKDTSLAQIDTDHDLSPVLSSPSSKMFTTSAGDASRTPIKGILKHAMSSSGVPKVSQKEITIAATPTSTSTSKSVRQPKMGILKNQFYSSHISSKLSAEDSLQDASEIVELSDYGDEDDNQNKSAKVPKKCLNQHVSIEMCAMTTNNDSAKPVATHSTKSNLKTNFKLFKSDKSSDTIDSSEAPMHPTANGSISTSAPLKTSTQRPVSRWAILGAKAPAPQSSNKAVPQQLNVNHLQVPSGVPSVVLKQPAPSSHASVRPSLAGPSTSLGFTSQQSQSQSQSLYPNITTQRVSDLRKILNPEVEKEDSFKKLSETIENCDCFEFNLNNAAKIITVLVLLATFIMVIKALKGDR